MELLLYYSIFHPFGPTHHFRKKLGSKIMDGLPQNTQRGQDENHSEDHTGSVNKEKAHVDKDEFHPVSDN